MTTEKLIEDTVEAFRLCQTADGMRVPDGFVLEWRLKAGTRWIVSDQLGDDDNRSLSAQCFYRLVPIPQPKRVPLTAVDIPPGSVLRHTTWQDGVYEPIYPGSYGKVIRQRPADPITYESLMADSEWRIMRPGEAWVPCWKVAVE